MGIFEKQVETSFAAARKTVCRTLTKDPELRHTYHANVAMTIYDNSDLSLPKSNVAAKAVVDHIFRESKHRRVDVFHYELKKALGQLSPNDTDPRG